MDPIYGNQHRDKPCYKISIKGPGSVGRRGKLVSDAEAIHVDLTDSSFEDISDIVNKLISGKLGKTNNMKSLESWIEGVRGARVISQSFDMLSNVYTMQLGLLSGGVTSKHGVEFLRVAAAYYVNGSLRKHFTPWSQGSGWNCLVGQSLKIQ